MNTGWNRHVTMDRPRDCTIVACPDARAPGIRPPPASPKTGFSTGSLQLITTSPRLGTDWRLESVRANPEARLPGSRGDALMESPTKRSSARRVMTSPSTSRIELLGSLEPPARALAEARTQAFDRKLADLIANRKPQALLTFSDVGSEHALAAAVTSAFAPRSAWSAATPSEEIEILAAERELAPDFLPIYLGGSPLDWIGLRWLHERRRQDADRADFLLAPSDHIALSNDRPPESRSPGSESFLTRPTQNDSAQSQQNGLMPTSVHSFSPEESVRGRGSSTCSRHGEKVRGPGRRLVMAGPCRSNRRRWRLIATRSIGSAASAATRWPISCPRPTSSYFRPCSKAPRWSPTRPSPPDCLQSSRQTRGPSSATGRTASSFLFARLIDSPPRWTNSPRTPSSAWRWPGRLGGGHLCFTWERYHQSVNQAIESLLMESCETSLEPVEPVAASAG